jgi:hypothetical protein
MQFIEQTYNTKYFFLDNHIIYIHLNWFMFLIG